MLLKVMWLMAHRHLQMLIKNLCQRQKYNNKQTKLKNIGHKNPQPGLQTAGKGSAAWRVPFNDPCIIYKYIS